MLTKRSIAILVIIAVILAGIAITLQLSDTEEVPTTRSVTGNSIKSTNGGEIGIGILPSPVEDKLANEGQS